MAMTIHCDIVSAEEEMFSGLIEMLVALLIQLSEEAARSRIAAYANPLLEKGYAVVSTDYRYSSEAIFTARIYDVKAAVRHIKAVAEDYDLNPHRIIAWGESTGGTLAALLAVSGDVEALSTVVTIKNPEEHKASGHFIDTCPPEAQKLYTAIWTELQK